MTFECLARAVWLLIGVNAEYDLSDLAPIGAIRICVE